MTLPGGPAAKYGHEYEKLWTIRQLVRILQGRAEAIRIEAPDLPKTEFWVDAGGRRELHQAKRQHSRGRWTLSDLGKPLVRAIGHHLRRKGDRFVLVSGSDAPGLRSLSEAARSAESVNEFLTEFLKSETRLADFQKLRAWWDCDDPTAIDLLQRIEVRCIDQDGIEEQVRAGLPALFVANPENVIAALIRIVDKSVHRALNREILVERLRELGYRLRRVTDAENAVGAIESVTADYLQGARSRLIQGKMVPRPTTDEVLKHIEQDGAEGGEGTDGVILGGAGSGKTACVTALVERLRAEGLPTLAFRLDRVPASAWKTTDLGAHLGLNESPALVLAAAAEATGRPGVLIVDQLDSASSMSGRNPEALDLAGKLVGEARSTRARVPLHTIIVCRVFDWKNDSHLRRLAPRTEGKPTITDFTITEFSTQEVRAVLTEAEFRPALFQARQLELLRLPQNLFIFLDAGFDPSRAPSFDTATRLFSRYWDEMRRRVKERIAPLLDEWMGVIETLCKKMTHAEQLFVAREALDQFQPEYVGSMVSEGVVMSFDDRLYGFGHESFFDYCFARLFVARQTSLRAFLTGSGQGLFRRAQVRQVLAYLRDSDFNRYVKELRQLLEDDDIRPHIKDLVLALLAEVPDPTQDEWPVWEKQIRPEIEALTAGTANQDLSSALARRRLFGSRSWFPFLDDTGVIKVWLESGIDRLVDLAVDCLDLHQRHHPDRVAATLEPYVDVGGEWVRRFRRVVLYARYGASRRFVDLLLKLLDNGVLDEDCTPSFQSQGLDGVFKDLADRRPEWVPEVLATRLRRRVAVIRAAGKPVKRGTLLGYSEYAAQALDAAVEKVPGDVVDHLLPIVLGIAESEAIDDTQPRVDAVWGRYMIVDATSREGSLLSALATALASLADAGDDIIDDVVADLRRRDTHTANHLLLALYRGGGARYADEAIALICDQPWRLQCGYVDNPKWCAMALIREVAPHCRPGTLARLEELLLTYRSPFEKTATGLRSQGKSRFDLLSAIPSELRSERATRHFRELTRKFGKPASEPKPITGGFVVSPIPSDATARMTDDQWLLAFTKHSSAFPRPRGGDLLKGGAVELSRELGGRAKEDPERFARLALRIPMDARPEYLEAILGALEQAPIRSELKVRVCEKAFSESREYHGRAIADVIGHMEEPFPDSGTAMLAWLAIDASSPMADESSQAIGEDDIYAHGINTTRGRAVQAIQRLIVSDAEYVERFRPIIERVTQDPHPAVLSCVAGMVRTIWRRDPELGLRLFGTMDLSEPRLLATPHMYDLVHHVVRVHRAVGRPLVQRMLRSTDTDVAEAGGRLAGLAALYHDNAMDLAAQACDGDGPQRLGIAQVASSNVKHPQCRKWCEENLVALFYDDDASVRRTAAGCFRAIGDAPLDVYVDLISRFCESRAFSEHADALIRVMKDSSHRLPGLTCDVCERFMDRLPPGSDRAPYLGDVSELVFRTYQDHLNDDWAKRALDLIDRLCLASDGGARERLKEFER